MARFRVSATRRPARTAPAVLRACLLAFVLLLPPPAFTAQADAPDAVPGEVVIAWHPDLAACNAIPASREPASGMGAATCAALAALAAPVPESLAGFATRPEWPRVAEALHALTGLRAIEAEPAYAMARLAVAPGGEDAEILRLARLPWVRYAARNWIARAAAQPDESFTPNDPRFGEQWNMQRVAAPEAWAATRGSVSIVVAVVDSGIDAQHPEFAGRVLPGYDYVNDDPDPADDFWHGTHVAGILGAATDNALGVAGLAPLVKILPLKVLDGDGYGSHYDIATGIRRAADADADIINLSLVSFMDDATLQDAVGQALDEGSLVVAAAGNCAQGGLGCLGANPDCYPAAYPGVLAVGASDRVDNWATYSGYKGYLGIAAPGGTGQDRVLSTGIAPDGYRFGWGTSMATPLVAGAAALVWTLQPGAPVEQVVEILKNTADKVGGNPLTGLPLEYPFGRNDRFGYGRLNAGRAVRWAYPPSLAAPADVQRLLVGGAVTQDARAVLLKNPSDQSVMWQATVTEGSAWLSVDPAIGTAQYSASGLLLLRAGPVLPPVGVHAGVVHVESLYPAGVPALDIRVELRVWERVLRAYVPLTVREPVAH